MESETSLHATYKAYRVGSNIIANISTETIDREQR